MTPQSTFMVVASVAPGQEGALRKVLSSLNHRPGVANPQNDLLPFGQLERLHFARFVILDDPTLGDISAYGLPRADIPPALAFLGDVDGPADEFLSALVQRADNGLRRIFAHCEGFRPGGDLQRWMEDHRQTPSASYVNWRGRTVRQIGEEAELRRTLVKYLQENDATIAAKDARRVREELVQFVSAEKRAGRLSLTAPEATPVGWRVHNFLHAVGVPLALLLLVPVLLLYLPVFVCQLRRRERSDPEIVPSPDPGRVRTLADLEDHDVTNQFTAIGTTKPGLFRRWTLVFSLWLLDYGARHVYNRGHLTRVSTIHFARWTFLDGKRRLLFASTYDGSLESYMDDFINKVAWGLNLVFSNGVGYPRTDWLIRGGAKDEQKFKRFIRRHELPTEVWYSAHPGLTAVDQERNTRIRQGLEQPAMTDAESREWLGLL